MVLAKQQSIITFNSNVTIHGPSANIKSNISDTVCSRYGYSSDGSLSLPQGYSSPVGSPGIHWWYGDWFGDSKTMVTTKSPMMVTQSQNVDFHGFISTQDA